MIVIRTESNNDICLPVSDFTNNLMSDLESWQKFGVVIVKNFILIYSQSFSRFLSFQSPSSGKGRTPISLVTRIPIGKGYKFNGVTHFCEFSCRSAHFYFCIIRMSEDEI